MVFVPVSWVECASLKHSRYILNTALKEGNRSSVL